MSYFPRTNTTIFTNVHRESWHNMIVSSWEIRSPGWLGHGCRSWHVSYKLLISVHREWYYREKLLRVLGITYHIITQKKTLPLGERYHSSFMGKYGHVAWHWHLTPDLFGHRHRHPRIIRHEMQLLWSKEPEAFASWFQLGETLARSSAFSQMFFCLF